MAHSSGPDTHAGDLLAARLTRWATERADRRALLFLEDGATEAGALTFAQLHLAALSVAGALQRLDAVGRPVLILSRSGLQFAIAFFGCVYAGAIAVPCSSGPRKRGLERILAIAANAHPAAALGDRQVADLLDAVAGPGLPIVRIDQLDGVGLARPMPVTAEQPVLLQYTSGSTAAPKGVVITHANLSANLEMITAFVGIHERSVYLTWLPLFHDMGLIGSLLHAMSCGIPCVLMPPQAFFLWPERWLSAIGRYGATITGGPNFAYEYCVRRHAQMDLSRIDLSGWEVAFCGGERVRAPTLRRFAELFEPAGFRAAALSPCYGLAEATLLVSGVARGGFHAACRQGIEVVSCGQSAPGVTLMVADPESGQPLADGTTGEIWVAGQQVSAGYWNNPAASADTFVRNRDGDRETHFLRTGDLGWIRDGELYVSGRLKDLIVCRGANFHPEDIEATAAQAHPALGGSSAAFSIEGGSEEQVVLVLELSRPVPDDLVPASVIAAVAKAVASEHTLHLFDVVLVRAGSIPRTTSGKVQRRRSRELYSEGRFITDAYAALRPLNSAQSSAGSSPEARPHSTP